MLLLLLFVVWFRSYDHVRGLLSVRVNAPYALIDRTRLRLVMAQVKEKKMCVCLCVRACVRVLQIFFNHCTIVQTGHVDAAAMHRASKAILPPVDNAASSPASVLEANSGGTSNAVAVASATNAVEQAVDDNDVASKVNIDDSENDDDDDDVCSDPLLFSFQRTTISDGKLVRN